MSAAIGRAVRSPAHTGVLFLMLVAVMTASASASPSAVMTASASASPSAVVPRASMADTQHQVMCVTCGIPLEEAVSPQADRERARIQAMIDQGMTAAQIRHALVIELGAGVLALPPRNGFDLAVYIVPVVVIACLLVILAVGLRRWRRRDPTERSPGPPEPELGLLDATRLDDELVRFDS